MDTMMIDPVLQVPKRPFEEDTFESTIPSKRSKTTSYPPTPPYTLSPSTPSTPSNNDTRPRIYFCTFTPCTASFTRPCRLAEHERSHTGERPFICPEADCGKTFSRDYHLSRHISITHTQTRNHICSYESCGKAFATAQRKREHEKTHEKTKEFACTAFEGCTETFRKKSTLAAHVAKVHMGVKPFPCGFINAETGLQCTSAYDSQGKLNEHIRKWHSGPRHFCTLCPPLDQPQQEEGNEDAMQLDDQPQYPRQPGFLTLQALLLHKKTHHPATKRPRGRPCKNKPDGNPLRIPKPRRRHNQHTVHQNHLSSLPSADLLLASDMSTPLSEPVPLPEPETISCLSQSCHELFMTYEELEGHCADVHGMALVEIADMWQERRALEGGVFWVGGLGYDDDEDEGVEFGELFTGL